MDDQRERRIRELLVAVKPLAVEYYQLTGKCLGFTGEVEEYVAAELLGLKLMAARTIGYDALRGKERIQIKGRAYGKGGESGQRQKGTSAERISALTPLLSAALKRPQTAWQSFPH